MIRLKDLLEYGVSTKTRGHLHGRHLSRNHMRVYDALRILGIDAGQLRVEFFLRHNPEILNLKSKADKRNVVRNFLRQQNTTASGLWSYPPELLWDILERAKKQYKTLAKKYHTDIGTGDNDSMVMLNLAWETIDKIFSRKGFELAE